MRNNGFWYFCSAEILGCIVVDRKGERRLMVKLFSKTIFFVPATLSVELL